MLAMVSRINIANQSFGEFSYEFFFFDSVKLCICKRRQVVVPAATVVGMTIYRHSTFQIYTLLALVVICLAISDWHICERVVLHRRSLCIHGGGGSGRRCRSWRICVYYHCAYGICSIFTFRTSLGGLHVQEIIKNWLVIRINSLCVSCVCVCVECLH